VRHEFTRRDRSTEAIGAGFSEARSTVGTRPYTAPEVLRDSEWRRWETMGNLPKPHDLWWFNGILEGFYGDVMMI